MFAIKYHLSKGNMTRSIHGYILPVVKKYISMLCLFLYINNDPSSPLLGIWYVASTSTLREASKGQPQWAHVPLISKIR